MSETSGIKLRFRKIDENKEQDLEQFHALMDDLSERAFDEELVKVKIRAMNRREDEYLLVAEDVETGILCGSAFAILFDDLCGTCQPVMVIENVVTHHAFRRRGVGRQLFAEIERWGRENHAHYTVLCSGMNRMEAHNFYHALGYEDVRGFKKYL